MPAEETPGPLAQLLERRARAARSDAAAANAYRASLTPLARLLAEAGDSHRDGDQDQRVAPFSAFAEASTSALLAQADGGDLIDCVPDVVAAVVTEIDATDAIAVYEQTVPWPARRAHLVDALATGLIERIDPRPLTPAAWHPVRAEDVSTHVTGALADLDEGKAGYELAGGLGTSRYALGCVGLYCHLEELVLECIEAHIPPADGRPEPGA